MVTFGAKIIQAMCVCNQVEHTEPTLQYIAWWQLIFFGFPTRFPHRQPVCVCATGSNPLAHVRASFSPADSRKITPFRCVLGGILREVDTESVALAEIIGVVLDGDAPSAPAGIPTCPHTAFVTAPAGIFFSLSHHSSNLIRFCYCHRGYWFFYSSRGV